MTDPEEPSESESSEDIEDKDLIKKEKKTKARLRKRGPYRKAHVEW